METSKIATARPLLFTIPRFPMPPSANQLYTPIHNKSRVVKSKTYQIYEKSIMTWIVSHQHIMPSLRAFFADIGSRVLNVDASFYMTKQSIINPDGKPRKNDTANRLKALHDVLSSTIIGIDDSYFWSGGFTKHAIDNDLEPYVNVDFSLRSIE